MAIIEISKVTKIAVLATIIGILISHVFSPILTLCVPIIILFLLMIFYPGCEKIGIEGGSEWRQAGFCVAFIEFIMLVISITI